MHQPGQTGFQHVDAAPGGGTARQRRPCPARRRVCGRQRIKQAGQQLKCGRILEAAQVGQGVQLVGQVAALGIVAATVGQGVGPAGALQAGADVGPCDFGDVCVQ